MPRVWQSWAGLDLLSCADVQPAFLPPTGLRKQLPGACARNVDTWGLAAAQGTEWVLESRVAIEVCKECVRALHLRSEMDAFQSRHVHVQRNAVENLAGPRGSTWQPCCH